MIFFQVANSCSSAKSSGKDAQKYRRCCKVLMHMCLSNLVVSSLDKIMVNLQWLK